MLNNLKIKEKTIKLFYNRQFIVLLVLLFLILSLAWFVYGLECAYYSGQISMARHFQQFFSKQEQNVKIENIAPWMTFGYINKSFVLDQNLLKNKLNITDENYPNLMIGLYAKRQKLRPESIIIIIQEVIINSSKNL